MDVVFTILPWSRDVVGDEADAKRRNDVDDDGDDERITEDFGGRRRSLRRRVHSGVS